jgi:hypothetical protein
MGEYHGRRSSSADGNLTLPKVSLRSFRVAAALVCGLLLCWASAQADTVLHLYRASVPVASQSEADRDAGFSAALTQVLIKATGREGLVQTERLTAQFPTPLSLIQSFSYRENPEALNARASENTAFPVDSAVTPVPAGSDLVETIPEPADAAASPMPFLLEVDFAPAAVDQQLSRLGIPVWGQTRPSVLVWVALEHRGQRLLLGHGDAFGLARALLDQAMQRGLALYLPSADLEDLVAVNLEDLFGLFPDAVSAGNQRYRPDVHVMMRIYQSADARWTANWSIFLKREVINGERQDLSPEDIASAMTQELSDYLAQRYAVLKPVDGLAAEYGTDLLFEVNQVNTFVDFIGLQRHLEALPPLSSVRLVSISGSRSHWRVQLTGTHEQLLEHIQLSGLLREQVVIADYPSRESYWTRESVPDVLTEPTLRFDWQGQVRSR